MSFLSTTLCSLLTAESVSYFYTSSKLRSLVVGQVSCISGLKKLSQPFTSARDARPFIILILILIVILFPLPKSTGAIMSQLLRERLRVFGRQGITITITIKNKNSRLRFEVVIAYKLFLMLFSSSGTSRCRACSVRNFDFVDRLTGHVADHPDDVLLGRFAKCGQGYHRTDVP